jgi:DNA-binding transcriptional MocR family regulator
VAPKPLLDRLVMLRLVSDFGASAVGQAALATLLATRGLERHVQRMRRVYAARLDALLAALAREMPTGTRWSTPRSGLVVWVTQPPGADAERIQQGALARGVAYARGELFHHDGRGGDHLALSFAALAPDAIAEGIARLGTVMREAAAGSGKARGPAKRAGRRTNERRVNHG